MTPMIDKHKQYWSVELSRDDLEQLQAEGVAWDGATRIILVDD